MARSRKKMTTTLVGALTIFFIGVFTVVSQRETITVVDNEQKSVQNSSSQHAPAYQALMKLEVKGRAPKTGYAREQFGAGWAEIEGCDMRNYILGRDFIVKQLDLDDQCTVLSGTLNDPYTGTPIQFTRGKSTSNVVQIDHVVALSDAWQKGAQGLDEARRAEFSNDPLNLLAVDGVSNNKKSDSDAATWLPPNKNYRCSYVARQVAVKQKYGLWITAAERGAIAQVLEECPGQLLPIE